MSRVNRQILKISSLFLLILAMLIIPQALLAETVNFSSQTLQINRITSFSLPLQITNAQNVFGVGFDLNFDSNLFEYVNVQEGTFLNQSCSTILMATPNTGKVVFGLTRLGSACGGVSGSGLVATFNFRSKTSDGTGMFSFTNNSVCILNNNACSYSTGTWLPTSVTIGVPNSAPVMTSVNISPSTAYKTTVNLAASAIAADADGDSVFFSYQWRKNGNNIVGQNGQTLSNANYIKNDTISLTVTPNDGNISGSPMTSTGVTILNSLPTQPAVSITSPAYNSTNLVCTQSGSIDADNDNISNIYSWYKNNVSQGSLTTNTVSASLTNVGESWRCRVTPNDGSANGTYGENSVTIVAELDTGAPIILSVNSDKANGSYTVGEIVDIDVTFSEAVTSTGNVTVTLEVGATDRTCTFIVTNTTIGTCNYTVQAGDSTSDLNVNTVSGTVRDTASNAMVNFAPASNLATSKNIVIDTTMPVITVSPASSNLTSNGATITWTTNENSTTQAEYGLSSSYGNSTTLNAILVTYHSVNLTGLAVNTIFHYQVKSRDLAGNERVSADYTFITQAIPNTAPTMTALITTPGIVFKTTHYLTASPTAIDAEGDMITFSYQWKKNNINISGQTSSTLTNYNYNKGDAITVTVTPNDGKVNGSPMTSTSITILNSFPTTPIVSVTNPAYDSTNLICTATGANDADGDSIQYIYNWYKNSVVQSSLVTNTINSSLTSVGEIWKCNAYASDGIASGLAGESSVTILINLDITPPVILSGSASNITYNSANIIWTTNEPSTTQLEYGLTSSYGSQTSLNNVLVTSHSASITNLTPDTLYHYKAKSHDAFGNLIMSNDYTFTTLSAPDRIAPSEPTGLTATAVSSSQINLSWNASADNISVLGYRIYRNGSEIGITANTTFQNLGINPSTAYSYCVAAYDSAGNTSAQSLAVPAKTLAPLDSVAPSISSVSISSLTYNSAVISWKTNEIADTQVEYGLTVSYGKLSPLMSNPLTLHSVTLSNLSPSALYHYRVRSKDAAGNLAVYSDKNFTTLTKPNLAPIVLSETYSTLENIKIFIPVIELLANDSDPDGQSLTLYSVGNCKNCLVSFDRTSNKTFIIFTPRHNYYGQSYFLYKVKDSLGAYTIGSTTVNIIENKPPVVLNDILSPTMQNVKKYILVTDLKANDSDPESQLLTVVNVFKAQNGSVSFERNSNKTKVIFTPRHDYSGPANFNYRIKDESGDITIATTSFEILPNNLPITQDDNLSTGKNLSIVIPASYLLANDSDQDNQALNITSVYSAKYGRVYFERGSNNTRIIFVPRTNYTGLANFKYNVRDESLGNSVGNVNIAIR